MSEKLEPITDSLYYVEEAYAEKGGDDLASMINILKDKVNEIVDYLNERQEKK